MAVRHRRKYMSHRRGAGAGEPLNDDMKIIELWCLRMLVLLGGHRKFIRKEGFSSDEILQALSLEEYIDKEVERTEFMSVLRERLLQAEKAGYSFPAHLTRNNHVVREELSLNDVESAVLSFAVLLHSELCLEECAETLGNLDKSKLIRVLATTLGYSQHEISQALAVKGQLAMTGLVKVDPDWSRDMKNKLDLMSGLADELVAPRDSSQSLFSNCYYEGIHPRLKKSDFLHVTEEYNLIREYLEHALRTKEEGVNILIYGEPGSGKSEMARSIVHSMQANLYEISMEDRDGDVLSGNARFSAYQLSQHILSRRDRAIILFDEIEDVFPDEGKKGSSKSGDSRKAWVNRLLETNRVPALWLSNRAYHIDPAFLRRFDYVLEMPEPDRRGRRRILERYLGGVRVSGAWIDMASEHQHLLPAHIEKAAKVASAMPDAAHPGSEQRNEKELERVLNGMMNVLRRPHLSQSRTMSMSTDYCLEYLNADIDLNRLLEGLERGSHGNLCFYGPPGTGKSALAGHIARKLERPLLAKKASDILNMFLGGTEENIALMFRQARKEGAVLLLDEADSLLRDRRGANRSWEVTQVNELLVQMEQFDGLFICSTNLMGDLDQASLRRFAIKAKFDYLRPEQALMMLKHECVVEPSAGDCCAVLKMDKLAPGDFAVVKKRMSILGVEATPVRMIEGLREEMAAKSGGRRAAIGFVA